MGLNSQDIIEIDGAYRSGSGTILRYAVSLASLIKKRLRVFNIRAKRKTPGLRPQHLRSLLACCQITGGSVKGAEVNSTEIIYSPGPLNKSRDSFSWDIGTAGSTTMLAFSILPLALFSKKPCRFIITGGLFQDFAPSAYHFQHVLLPLLETMGARAELTIVRPGYVPKGQGELQLITYPVADNLRKISLLEQGDCAQLWGIALSSHLEKQKVSQRMAEACREILARKGYKADFQIINDTSAAQRGAALFLTGRTTTGCLLGADMAGKIGKRAETIGTEVATMFLEDVTSGATVDRHLADQIILFAALAAGTTEYLIPKMTEHIDTNLWLVEKILGARTRCEGKKAIIYGIGFSKKNYDKTIG